MRFSLRGALLDQRFPKFAVADTGGLRSSAQTRGSLVASIGFPVHLTPIESNVDSKDQEKFAGLTLRAWGIVASAVVTLLVTAVPYYNGQRTFDSNVAAGTVAALASMWAAIFTLESLRDLAHTRRTELEASIFASLVFESGEGFFWLTNTGRAAAFDVSARYVMMDADGDYTQDLPVFAPAVVLADSIEKGLTQELGFFSNAMGRGLPAVVMEVSFAAPAFPDGRLIRSRFAWQGGHGRHVRTTIPDWPDTTSREKKLHRLADALLEIALARIEPTVGLVTEVAATPIGAKIEFFTEYKRSIHAVSVPLSVTMEEILERFKDRDVMDLLDEYVAETTREARRQFELARLWAAADRIAAEVSPSDEIEKDDEPIE